MRRSAGYSMVEVVVSMAIFTVFLLVLVGLQREFIRFDRENRVQMFSHPAPLAVLARLQRDILDSKSYPIAFQDWTQSPETLLLSIPSDTGFRTVVWDFTDPAVARRIEFKAGSQHASWTARAVPQYEIGSWEMPDGRVAVRVRSYDETGRLSVDRVILPRAN